MSEGTAVGWTRRDWILRYGLLALSSAALLATSSDDPPSYQYTFHVDAASTHIELTETKPSVVLRISVRADSLGTDSKPSTESASVSLNGSVLSTGVAAGSTPFVRVQMGPSGADGGGGETLNVVTEFALHDSLAFTGDCTTFSDADPCDAEVILELERGDGGDGGGVVAVDVLHEMSSTFPKSGPPSSRGPAPWTVEVTVE